MPDEMSRPLVPGWSGSGGSRQVEASLLDPNTPTIGILGAGDFSRSLARRLVASGYQVVVGSRSPARSVALFPEEVEVTSQMEAATQADVVFVAVFPEHHSTLVALKSALVGKTLVDISNSLGINRDGPSNAEQLSNLFPDSFVVKGFNTLSAWALQMGPWNGIRQVLLCGNSSKAKDLVKHICHRMGLIPVDMGFLSSSLEIENLPHHLFPSWRIPVLCMLCLFIFFYLYNFIQEVIHPLTKMGKGAFYKMPIEVVNASFPSVALVMLALVYLPGLFAAFFQLRWGTKYKRFPDWLDQWLTARKQFGLCSFLCAVMHAVYSLSLPLRKSARYKLSNMAYQQVKAGVENLWDDEEVWRMELYLSAGIMALGLLSLLAVTSLPSVANTLNWREFTFIQVLTCSDASTYYSAPTLWLVLCFPIAVSFCFHVPSSLGYCALTAATTHTLIFGWNRAFTAARYPFYLPPSFVLVLILPCVVLCGRLALFLPCVGRRLWKIRRGWERSRQIRFALPGDNCHNGGEDVSNV